MKLAASRSCFWLILVTLHMDDAFTFYPSLATTRNAHTMQCSASLESSSDEEPLAVNAKAILEYDDFLPDPNPDMQAADVLSACMSNLRERQQDGLEVCWRFSSDRCRAALGGAFERFAQHSTNPVFGYLVNCKSYAVLSMGTVIKGTPTRGDMQTILIGANQSDGKGEEFPRRFLWTFQKERRPPRQNCWTVHEVLYVENACYITE